MRIVNQIDREMIQAEWENWLLDEVVKCKALKTMVDENTTESLSNQNGQAGTRQHLAIENDHDRFREIRAWLDDYCGSCSRERKKLLGGPIKVNTNS